MAGTVSFKVYLTPEDGSSQEVRRFGVDVDAVTNFVYLSEKLQTIFPSLRGKGFTVSWRDADKDQVTISSDEELRVALAENPSGNIFRLYVVMRSDYASGRNVPRCDSGPIHTGIVCDGCDKRIQGFRYKCVQCADYDLCADCERNSMHAEHCMLRLSTPLQWKPHYGKRLASHVNRFMRKAHLCDGKEEDEAPAQCPFRAGKHHSKYRYSRDCSPTWIDRVASYLDEMANLPDECPAKEAATKPKEATEAKEATAESIPPTSTSAAAKEAESTKRGDINPADQIKLLTNVGLAMGETFLSQFLDPFVNLQTRGDKAPTSGERETTNGAQTPTASSSSSTLKNSEQEVPSPNINETAAPYKFPGEGKKLGESGKDEAAATASQPILITDEPKHEPAKRVSFESEGWTLLNRNDSPTPSVVTPVPSAAGAIPKQVKPTAPIDAPTKPIYPTLPEVPTQKPAEIPIIYHPNPTIQKSVESMIQMGFSNEGSWLTNLLVSKGGDIAAALDALSPVRR